MMRFNFSSAQDWNRLVREKSQSLGVGELWIRDSDSGNSDSLELNDTAGDHQKTTCADKLAATWALLKSDISRWHWQI